MRGGERGAKRSVTNLGNGIGCTFGICGFIYLAVGTGSARTTIHNGGAEKRPKEGWEGAGDEQGWGAGRRSMWSNSSYIAHELCAAGEERAQRKSITRAASHQAV